MEEKQKYSVKDIIREAKYSFGLDTYSYQFTADNDERIKRKIQRYTKKNMTPISTKGRTKFYSLEQVEQMLYSDKGLHNYFVSLAKEGKTKGYEIRLKSDKEYNHQISETIDENMLTDDEFLQISVVDSSDFPARETDSLTNTKYLTLEEARHLNKKDLFLREDLTEEEVCELLSFYSFKKLEEEIKNKAKELFQQKKLEIMLTALFNEKFKLDEDLLSSDARNFCEISYVGVPEPGMLRSSDRLKDFRYYCKPNDKKSDDHDEE